MKTQDLEKIPEDRKDTVFQAEFGINEKPGIITREEFSKAFKEHASKHINLHQQSKENLVRLLSSCSH